VEGIGFEKILKDFEELKAGMDGQTVKKLNLDILERIIKRVVAFSPDCEECRRIAMELDEHINKLREKKDRLDKNDFKHNQIKINDVTAHLQKQHKLVTEGSYTSIYMCFGMSIGVVFGLTVFHNIALGIPIGMCLGLAIGASMDADAKKKGMTI
jgi:hypothetical protein